MARLPEVPVSIQFPWRETHAVADQMGKIAMAFHSLAMEMDRLSTLMEQASSNGRSVAP